MLSSIPIPSLVILESNLVQRQAASPYTQDFSERPTTCANEHDENYSSHVGRLCNEIHLHCRISGLSALADMEIAKYYHDLNEIRDGLYLGSRRAEHSLPLATLQDVYGITHVVQASLCRQVTS